MWTRMRQSAGSAGRCIAPHPVLCRLGQRALLRVRRGLGPCPLCHPRRLWLPARRPPRHGAQTRGLLPRPLPPHPAARGRGGTSTPPLHPHAVHQCVSCGVVMSTTHRPSPSVRVRGRVACAGRRRTAAHLVCMCPAARTGSPCPGHRHRPPRRLAASGVGVQGCDGED